MKILSLTSINRQIKYIRLTQCSSCDFCFTRKSVDWWIRLIDSCLTHVLYLQVVLVVKLWVLNSPDLVDSDAAVVKSGGVVAGSDELRLERADDKVLDVVVDLRR